MIYGQHRNFEEGRSASGSFRDLSLVVNECADLLKRSSVPFDTIVVTGVSGMSVGFPLAVAMGKRIAVLRKDDDSTHSCNEGDWQGFTDVRDRRCLWVDDFICSGDTQVRIDEAVHEIGGTRVGYLLYAGLDGVSPPLLTWQHYDDTAEVPGDYDLEVEHAPF